jgi:lipopolysaccharide export system protein LptA
VHVLQGDTEMRCKVLTVFYEEETGTRNVKAAEPGPAATSRSAGSRPRARRGGPEGSKRAGDAAIFNMRENTVTLTGNVVVTRGVDILRGQRLVVDLTTGVSKMDRAGWTDCFNRSAKRLPIRAQRSREEMTRVWTAGCQPPRRAPADQVGARPARHHRVGATIGDAGALLIGRPEAPMLARG